MSTAMKACTRPDSSIAHEKTKSRMAQPAEMKLFHLASRIPGRAPFPPSRSLARLQPQPQRRHASTSSTTIPPIPTPTFTSTSTMPMCCTPATSSSTRSIPSSMKAPAVRSAAPLTRHKNRLPSPVTTPRSFPAMVRWADKADLKSTSTCFRRCAIKWRRSRKAGASEQEVICKKAHAPF